MPEKKKKQQIESDSRQALRDIFHSNRYSLDIRFLLKDGQKHKCAILVPGGGYSLVCSFVEGVPIAKQLNAHGISAVIVYYRTKKKAIYPNPQDDLAQAVREVFANAEAWNLDMSDYSVWGASAGGHLTASFGTDHMGYPHYGLPKPGALVLTYPVITMEKSLTHQGTHDNLIGADATKEEEDAKSIHLHVTKDYPPTYIWCGDDDHTVPPKNTELMADALKAAAVPYEKDVFPGVDHGVGTGKYTAADGWIEKAIEFWNGPKNL